MYLLFLGWCESEFVWHLPHSLTHCDNSGGWMIISVEQSVE